VHACTVDQETINCGLAQLLRYILQKNTVGTVPVFLVNNCGWGRGLLCHEPLDLALVAGPYAVGSG